MRGNILSFDQNIGLISGHDGNRYTFSRMDWGSSFDPAVGQEVDFTNEGDKAKSVFAIKAGDNFKPGANKITLALVCFFLGMFGVHRFIVGKTGSGGAMLAVTLAMFILVPLLALIPFLGFIPMLGLLCIWIWAIVDFVMILIDKFEDKNGRKITSWT